MDGIYSKKKKHADFNEKRKINEKHTQLRTFDAKSKREIVNKNKSPNDLRDSKYFASRKFTIPLKWNFFLTNTHTHTYQRITFSTFNLNVDSIEQRRMKRCSVEMNGLLGIY